MIREWLEAVALRWQGGKFDECVFGHGEHATTDCTLTDGSMFRVFDASRYETEIAGYCDGRDEVSRAVIANHWWEQPGTALVRQHCRGGIVIDIGSHVGWYTVHAARRGCDVLAVDASVEHLRVLAHNAAEHAEHVVPCRAWIGDATPPVGVPRGIGSVKLVKIDIEGGEADAVGALWPLFASQFIEHALIEVSPVFVGLDASVDLVLRLLGAGYSCRCVPDVSGDAEIDITPGTAEAVLRHRSQRDLWFTRSA